MVLLYPNPSAQPTNTAAKICTSCHQEKSTCLFHLKGRDKTGEQRYQSACKDCANLERTARYSQKKMRLKVSARPNVGNYAIEIFFHQSESSGNLMEIMNDYIEAIYANRSNNCFQSKN